MPAVIDIDNGIVYLLPYRGEILRNFAVTVNRLKARIAWQISEGHLERIVVKEIKKELLGK